MLNLTFLVGCIYLAEGRNNKEREMNEICAIIVGYFLKTSFLLLLILHLGKKSIQRDNSLDTSHH